MTEETRDMTQMANILAEAEKRVLAARKSVAPPLPEVVEAGAPAVWREGKWYVYFPISTSLKEVRWVNRVLKIPPKDQLVFNVGLGLMVGEKGDYVMRGVKVLFPKRTTLPHIDGYEGCLRLYGLPKNLLTLDDYWDLHKALTEHCEGVQLDSLYTSHGHWPQGLFLSLPEEVREYLIIGTRRAQRGMLEIFPQDGGETWDVVEEEDGLGEEEPDPEYHRDYCDCPDCRREREEAEEEQPDEAPVAEQVGDIWEMEGV